MAGSSMTVTRKSVEFAKRIFADRVGDDYVYGGTWNPNDVSVGCDCSGLVTDILSATFDGTAMPWDREGLSTESYRYLPMGQQQVGPFTLMHVSSPDQIPADAVMRIDLHHEGEGGPDSHMHCVLDGWVMESNGSYGTCTLPKATSPNSLYWNDWWYVPGPIVEDDTPRTVLAGCPNFTPGVTAVTTPAEPTDTLFADVSEFQCQVDDTYPYPVLSIRVCDGAYMDHNFAENYAWMRKALDSGKLVFGIVYCFVEVGNIAGTYLTLKSMIDENGGLHPKVVLMLDVEAGGDPNGGDASAQIDQLYSDLVAYAGGNPLRVIGYGNTSDLNRIWITKPTGERVIVAAYGSNPSYPNEVAHQYTDGQVGAGSLPSGCAPFGNCDMNSADGLSPTQFAAACGITSGDDMALVPQDQWDTLFQKITNVWNSRSPFRHLGEGPVDDTVGYILNDDSSEHIQLVIKLAEYGDPPTLALLNEVASADPTKYPDRQGDAALAQRVLAKLNSAPVATAPVAPVAALVAPVVSPDPTPAPAAPAAPVPSNLGSALTTLAHLLISKGSTN